LLRQKRDSLKKYIVSSLMSCGKWLLNLELLMRCEIEDRRIAGKVHGG
jgi:hypothetical protein